MSRSPSLRHLAVLWKDTIILEDLAASISVVKCMVPGTGHRCMSKD